ncbi:MAG TPA: right-handed parallel beta-helix repeat-containing protein [Burkholderiaceae bacterium]|nr:right-handed parallel beta-helix repeat-containing protein [Burkholderiaceae bacterium]
MFPLSSPRADEQAGTPGPAPTSGAPTARAPASGCSEASLKAHFPHGQPVTRFGVRPGSGSDQTGAIEQAIRAAGPDAVLLFPPGIYRHARRILVGTAGVQLVGLPGARLHATSLDEQAVFIAADRVALRCFTLTAVTSERGTTPWASRIAIYPHFDESRWVSGVEITGNAVIPHADGGRQHAATNTAGIYVVRGSDFRILGNRIVRSLSDGIHVTQGSRDGEIAFNDISQTGDDHIGLVSYGPAPGWLGSASAAQIAEQRVMTVNRDLNVHDNVVSNALWGRGISVVGGERIAIARNTVSDTQMAAGIIVARESSFQTWGSRDVTITGNTITQNQTGDSGERRTGHGAIEIHALIPAGVDRGAPIVENLGVHRVVVTGNTIAGAAYAGIRIGSPRGSPAPTRAETVSAIEVTGNRISGVGTRPVEWNLPRHPAAGACSGNLYAGTPAAC